MKKIVMLLAVVGICFAQTGCRQILDAISTPEEIVADYALHLADIMNTTADCDELSKKLHEYCSSREEVVTKAVADTVTRIKNDEIDDAAKDAMEKKLESIKNTNMTSCLLTPSVNLEKLACLKPLLGVSNAK